MELETNKTIKNTKSIVMMAYELVREAELKGEKIKAIKMSGYEYLLLLAEVEPYAVIESILSRKADIHDSVGIRKLFGYPIIKVSN